MTAWQLKTGLSGIRHQIAFYETLKRLALARRLICWSVCLMPVYPGRFRFESANIGRIATASSPAVSFLVRNFC
jgi:hypothetical protein